MNDAVEGTSQLELILENLSSSNIDERLKGIKSSAQLEKSSAQILLKLEQLAAGDRSTKVQEAATNALKSPAHRSLQKNINSTIHIFARQNILTQIKKWVGDGLITQKQGEILSQKYNFDTGESPPISKVKEKPKKAEKQERTLSDIFIDPATIQIALYLGAFFIIAAAAIFSSLSEFLRIPILVLTAFAFLGATLVLKKRMQQASFVMFTIFSLLIPINASVIANTIDLNQSLLKPYWVIVVFMLMGIWGFGTWYFNSRFYSILAVAASSWLVLLISDWISPPYPLIQLILGILMIGQIGIVSQLMEWKDKTFSSPLIWFIHIQQILILFSTPAAIPNAVDQDPAWWIAIAFTWVFASTFYFINHRLLSRSIFPYLSIFTLLPVPWLIMAGIEPEFEIVMVVTWIWGACLAFLGEYLITTEKVVAKHFGTPSQIAGAILFACANLISLTDNEALGSGLLFVTTLIYTWFTISFPRPLIYGAALFNALLAYFSLYLIPPLENLDVYPGYIILWPTILFLGGELLAKFKFKARNMWHQWPKWFGVICGNWAFIILIVGGFNEPLKSAIGLLILSIFIGFYAWAFQQPRIGYLSTSGAIISLMYLLGHLDNEIWMLPLTILILVYFGIGFLFLNRDDKNPWGKVFMNSSLVIGGAISLSAPFDGDAQAVISVALIASLFVVEGFKRRNVWFGFPANLLYLMAYFMILIDLEIDHPQYYSVPTAMLGLGMHYLLLRSKNSSAAFATGMLSQIILLSTTYIQMVATGESGYFFFLFFQAMVVLGYGIVIRSRSLVITPAAFIILSVVTVMFKVLEGLMVLFVIGCSGFILLGAGVAAMFMRERVIAAREKLSDRFSDWQA